MAEKGKHKNYASIIGLALFSMFFGSGNLIFPLSVGQQAEDQFMYGILGFILTGVIVPFLGVITMVLYKGSYMNFFSTIGRIPGFILCLVLLTFWIPLGSGPRCVTVAYASIDHLLMGCPLWLFSLLYCTLVFLLTIRKNRIIDILGYVLTPVLLTSLFVVMIRAFFTSDGLAPSTLTSTESLKLGFLEGYNTMDLIASFFFSSTVIEILREAQQNKDEEMESDYLKLALKSSIIGIVILAVVYLGMLLMSALHAPVLQDIPKESLLPYLTRTLLGQQFSFVATLAISMACMTTSIALLVVYSDFLRAGIFRNKISTRSALILTSAVTFGMSMLGFQGISKIATPAFQVIYPTLIIMIIVNLGSRMFRSVIGKREGLQVL